MKWDLFCRVIDNLGDIGVCWRLAVDLAERGESVRLFVDDAAALAWMAPRGAVGVSVQPWPRADTVTWPADVVIEAFGCELPPQIVSAMASQARPPVWINLEHLSAEAYVERSHRLPSPRPSGPGAGLVKWFFYPGFTPATGGLIRERELLQRQAAFDADAWLVAQGARRRGNERMVSLFCYTNPALPDLLHDLARQPTLLLVTDGLAAQQVIATLGPSLVRDALRVVMLPRLTQADYDHLLWASDLNFVRGEDSWVRAQWAGRPFVWQAYPQHDGAHTGKVEAFLDRLLAGAPQDLAEPVRAVWRHWNGSAAASARPPAGPAWRQHTLAWRDKLLAQADLTTQLIGFASEKG
jgi:uncharacterized repeat protein (TIGR03837 family)